MQIRFVLPPTVDSPLARLDARWRLAGLIAVLFAIAATRTLIASLLGLSVALVLVVIARPPWRWLLGRAIGLSLVVGAFALPLPLVAGETTEGLRFATMLLLKALALFFVTSVLLVTAPLETTLAAAGSLGVPRLLTHLTLMTLRYLFLLGEELARLRIALRVRGFRNRAGMHSYHTVAAAMGMVLVRGNARAVRIAQAMRCRGFDGRFRSTEKGQTTIRNVLFFVVAASAGVVLIVIDYRGEGWHS